MAAIDGRIAGLNWDPFFFNFESSRTFISNSNTNTDARWFNIYLVLSELIYFLAASLRPPQSLSAKQNIQSRFSVQIIYRIVSYRIKRVTANIIIITFSQNNHTIQHSKTKYSNKRLHIARF